MLLFRSDPLGGTRELLPCGLLGGDLVELFRKSNSKYYWYDFTVRGERYRGQPKRPTKGERKRLLLSNSLPQSRAATRSTNSRPRFVNARSISFNGWKRTARVRQPPLLQKRVAIVGSENNRRNAHGPNMRESTLAKAWCTGSGCERGKLPGCHANLSSTVHATTSEASFSRKPEI